MLNYGRYSGPTSWCCISYHTNFDELVASQHLRVFLRPFNDRCRMSVLGLEIGSPLQRSMIVSLRTDTTFTKYLLFYTGASPWMLLRSAVAVASTTPLYEREVA